MEEHPVAKTLRDEKTDYEQVIVGFDREALTDRWHYLFRTWPSDGWDGAGMARAMHNAKVRAVEEALAVIHAVEGHGPFECLRSVQPYRHSCVCQQALWPDCAIGDATFFDRYGKPVTRGYGVEEALDA